MKTPTPICPLGLRLDTPPLEQLTAEEARNCVKAFGDLPYSPADAELAATVAEAIAKHAHLGFGEVRLDRAIPEKMAETLRARGFRVFGRYAASSMLGNSMFTMNFYGRVHPSTSIQWQDNLPEPPIGENIFDSFEEALKKSNRMAAERTEEWKIKKETPVADKAADKAVKESPLSSGCLWSGTAMLALIGTAAAIGFLYLLINLNP